MSSESVPQSIARSAGMWGGAIRAEKDEAAEASNVAAERSARSRALAGGIGPRWQSPPQWHGGNFDTLPRTHLHAHGGGRGGRVTIIGQARGSARGRRLPQRLS